MIITRAPLRLTLAGGGTDLPSYFERQGATWISVAINKYCFSQINPSFTNNFLMKYSEYEKCEFVEDIKHPLIRESLKYLGIRQPLELTFSADLPGRTGLGSSSSFLVSLLKALHEFQGSEVTSRQLAEESTEIEMNILQTPIGLQDQYIAAVGGLKEFYVTRQGKISWTDLEISVKNSNHLFSKMRLYFTGIVRDSSVILSEQVSKSNLNDEAIINQLDYVANQVSQIRECVLNADEIKLGNFFHDHWLMKKKRSSNMSTLNIDNFYSEALENGAIGGKIVGAGGGGFILMVCSDQKKIDEIANKFKFKRIEFSLNSTGVSRILSV